MSDNLARALMPDFFRARTIFNVASDYVETHCWQVVCGWNSGNGYYKLRHEGKGWLAHRLAYYFAHGHVPSPREKLLDHKCRNRACWRPSHLEPVTVKVNTMRGKAVLFRCT